MAKTFNYEYWSVDILSETGRLTWEFKGKSKRHVIRQIEKEIDYTNSKENLSKKYVWDRKPRIREVFWDTLTLDRIGYESPR